MQQYMQRMQPMRQNGGGEERPSLRQQPNWWRGHWWQVLVGGIAVLGLVWLVYGYISTKMQLDKITNSKGGSDVQQITNQVSKFMDLPSEAPTLATVNDVSKLKGQEFFKNAQNGDKVLIFSNSGRALLYRPSSKHVVEYAKVDLNASGSAGTGANSGQ